jgi:pilus assembly protein Flp/PilA
LKQLLARFVGDESGATAIEYCLIAAGVSLAIVAIVGSLGSTVKTSYLSVDTALK